jgi:hypothetical protein
MERFRFMPIKPGPDWNDEKDRARFIEIWGESDDYRRDTTALLEEDIAKVHTVLEAGINYFARKRQAPLVMPPSVLPIAEKVALFAELMPVSAEDCYTVRFSMNLARILWLDLERWRIAHSPEDSRWLYPVYQVADDLADAACELEESLRCEHKDFDPGIDEEEAPGVA